MGLFWEENVSTPPFEAIVDLASPEFHELARIAKDAAAGGVFICSIASFVIGFIIFFPRIMDMFGIVF